MKIAEPLPECALCGRPTKRVIHARNDGLCSRCRGSFSGLRVVDDSTVFARGGYPPSLFEIDHGDDDDA